MLFSGRIGLSWESKDVPPQSHQIYNAVMPNGHYFLAQYIDGKWFDTKSNEVKEDFKYLELFDETGKFLPDVEWVWVVDSSDEFTPMYDSRDFPKGDRRSAWSYHCLVVSRRGQIRIGKYNYLTQEYITLGEDPISDIVAFCNIE